MPVLSSPLTVVSPASSRSVASTATSAASASGAAPPYIPECAGPAIVRTVTSTEPVPRRLVVTVGVPSSTLPASAISITSAANSSGSVPTSRPSPPFDISSEPSHTTRTPTGHGCGSARRAVSSITRLPLQSAAPRP